MGAKSAIVQESLKSAGIALDRRGTTFIARLPTREATVALGRALAAQARAGDLILLKGQLGVGKTTLARALVGAFLPGQEVPSPSFTLVQSYEAEDLEIVHFDLYRLESESDIIELGFEEAVGRALVIVEWPEVLRLYLPDDRLEVTLAYGAREGEREAVLAPFGRWLERLFAKGES